MNFCSNCGEKVELKKLDSDQHFRFYCKACDTIHYQNPKMVVACLPIWEDQILLCSRSIKPRIGFWDLPGGFLEMGEGLEVGALREAAEEANAKVDLGPLHFIYNVPHINIVYFYFLSKLSDQNFAPGEESLEVKLFKEAEIPWENLAFSSTYHSLRYYFEDVNKGEHSLHMRTKSYK